MKETKEKMDKRNRLTPPCTFRYQCPSLKRRMLKAAKKDNRSIGFAINQAIEDYCTKMGV